MVGPDMVHIGDEVVTIFALHEMPDWTVREFSIVPIFFRDHKFYLKSKRPGSGDYACAYELAPWYPQLGLESSRIIHYEEDYVAERDREFRLDRKHDHLHSALYAVYPLLGWCWSGFKERVLGRIGFDPVSITEASIMFAFACFMAEAVFVCYFRLGFLALAFSRMWLLWVDYLLFVLLPLDCAVRYGCVISGDTCPPGFLEWIFRRTPPDRPQI